METSFDQNIGLSRVSETLTLLPFKTPILCQPNKSLNQGLEITMDLIN